MKRYVFFALLGLVGTTVPVAQDTYKKTPCNANNVGSSCTRFDGSKGICKEQYCATMNNPNQKCYVCAKKQVTRRIVSSR